MALYVVAASFTGCAVQKLPGGKVSIGIDNAELLGQNVATFKLDDGSEGRLRVLGGKYSIKLQQWFRVVDIPHATAVRLLSSDSVAGRTLLVLEKTDRSCNNKTQVMSIKGADVLIWDIGYCRRPEISIQEDQAFFDFANGARTTRFIYRDAALFRGEFATFAMRSPAAPSRAGEGRPEGRTEARTEARTEGGPRYVPGPPVAAPQPRDSGTGSAPQTSTASAPRPSTARTRPTASPRPALPAPARTLDFPIQEQKPIRIVLDR